MIKIYDNRRIPYLNAQSCLLKRLSQDFMQNVLFYE